MYIYNGIGTKNRPMHIETIRKGNPMPPKDLSPRDGAHIPRQERMTEEQRMLMQQVEDLTKSESAALAVLAQASLGTQAAVEDAADRLQEIVDLLVKAMKQFGVELPAAISKAMADKEYDPDYIEPEGPEGGEDDEEEEPEDAKDSA